MGEAVARQKNRFLNEKTTYFNKVNGKCKNKACSFNLNKTFLFLSKNGQTT